jgi:hypothetical protein
MSDICASAKSEKYWETLKKADSQHALINFQTLYSAAQQRFTRFSLLLVAKIR